MTTSGYLLAIDQGTTSTRAILFSADGEILGQAQQEFPQIYPEDGWVEHDPELIWRSVISVCRAALHNSDLAIDGITAIGITNQRETTVVWDRESGRPLCNAIVWQDRRTADLCVRLKDAGHSDMVRAKTGLILDPYFSATKLKWILDNVPGAANAAREGRLAFGTIDSFLIWRLTGGKVHATDATNASRTMLFNIHDQCWDKKLLDLFSIPISLLPEVKDCADDFGLTDKDILGAEIPIRGVAGDQQAALFGQTCFQPGDIKCTYGTGCFAILNTGDKAVVSKNRLLTTVGYRLSGEVSYALEGSIFVAGAAVKWLRDKLQVIEHAAETETIAEALHDTGGVYLVPAFAGFGAPYWEPNARGALVGMTLDSNARDIVRAALEAVAYQTRDLLQAMQDDGAQFPTALRVDGGMVANNWLMQFLADILDLRVDRPEVAETTALGAAFLAGIGAGIFQSPQDIAQHWRLDQSFEAQMPAKRRERAYAGWQKAVQMVLT